MEEASYSEVSITCREVKQRKEKPGRTAEEKTDVPFQGQEEEKKEEKKEEEFLTGGDWSDLHRWKGSII